MKKRKRFWFICTIQFSAVRDLYCRVQYIITGIIWPGLPNTFRYFKGSIEGRIEACVSKAGMACCHLQGGYEGYWGSHFVFPCNFLSEFGPLFDPQIRQDFHLILLRNTGEGEKRVGWACVREWLLTFFGVKIGELFNNKKRSVMRKKKENLNRKTRIKNFY